MERRQWNITFWSAETTEKKGKGSERKLEEGTCGWEDLLGDTKLIKYTLEYIKETGRLEP
jgi:hypothetical protein